MSKPLIGLHSGHVGAWFGLTFSRGSDWRNSFHEKVIFRAALPFWRSKLNNKELGDKLLSMDTALSDFLRYLVRYLIRCCGRHSREHYKQGVCPSAVVAMACFVAERMSIYTEMVNFLRGIKSCDDHRNRTVYTSNCCNLLQISPDKRYAHLENTPATQSNRPADFDEVREALKSSENVKIEIEFVLELCHNEGDREARKITQAVDEAFNKSQFHEAKILIKHGLNISPFSGVLFGMRGLCHLYFGDTVSADVDGKACRLLDPHCPEGFIVGAFVLLETEKTSNKVDDLVTKYHAMCTNEQRKQRRRQNTFYGYIEDRIKQKLPWKFAGMDDHQSDQTTCNSRIPETRSNVTKMSRLMTQSVPRDLARISTPHSILQRQCTNINPT
ncbi:hypothetical protein CAPTEDRAFT_218159 [Capitella teleta]|uniref:Uncharacterized protein n=1 Tax=Capitella teleta TaxID=283909 RepID=R7U2S3_CAPTE|nr:hypothetical protein CAPTEDRAFT_218159 [Capitella teleta]|eukprot:ELT97951.1 hypothetical protein CAPTEDRAFT_218159 [Capitella teleta]